MDPSRIEPDRYYWAIEKMTDAMAEVVYISTVFGKEREYWTVARIDNETHAMIDEFDFLEPVLRPSGAA